jgi:hypothetical protein
MLSRRDEGWTKCAAEIGATGGRASRAVGPSEDRLAGKRLRRRE